MKTQFILDTGPLVALRAFTIIDGGCCLMNDGMG